VFVALTVFEGSPSAALAFYQESGMGKYFIAWILGVPAGLLILIYLFAHLF